MVGANDSAHETH